MSENFQDFVSYGGSTLADLGDAILVGGTNTNAASKSVIFNNSSTSGALVWGPSVNRVISLPDASGVILLSSQGILSISAGGAQVTSGQIIYSNSNGVSFGVNGQTITASVATQTNQTVGLYALGNTTQNSSTTLDARTLSFNGLGNITVGYSNGSIQISGAGGGGSPNFSAGTTSGNLGSIVFSNSNGVSFGLNGSTITASAAGGGQTTAGFYALGNTTQNSSTTLALNSISFNGIGALTVGYSNSSIQLSAPQTSSLVGVGGLLVSTNGSTISVSGPSLTNFEPFPPTATTVFTAGQNSWYFEPVEVPGNISGGRINRIINFTSTAGIFVATTSASFGTGTSGSHSGSYVYANTLALYSLGTGTNSTRLESFWSNSFSVGLKQSVSISQAGGTAISVTQAGTISYIQSINSAGAYTTGSSTASVTLSTASAAMSSAAITTGLSTLRNMLSGVLLIPIGFNTTIIPGNYWLGQGQSTTTTTAGTSQAIWNYSNQSAISIAAVSNPRVWGQTATTTGALYPGRGVYSAASAAPPATVGFTQLNTVGGTQHYFNWINSTI